MTRRRQAWDRSRVLAVAVAREAAWGGLWVHRYRYSSDSLRRCVRKAVRAGHLRRTGRHHTDDIYVVTDAGRAWLAQQGQKAAETHEQR